jgi:hypothetical protein
VGIFALWSNWILDFQTNLVSPLGECGTVDNGVQIGGVYCIVDAGEPRLYMVGSRGVEGHGRREASAVGCCGKRCAVHVAIWLETMICGKQQAIRLRNLGVGIMHCGLLGVRSWVSGLGCWVLGVGRWVLGAGCLVWMFG